MLYFEIFTYINQLSLPLIPPINIHKLKRDTSKYNITNTMHADFVGDKMKCAGLRETESLQLLICQLFIYLTCQILQYIGSIY